MTDREDMGVPASPSGCQPSASAAEEASSQSGIPNAGLLPNTTYYSCPICYGSRTAFGGDCSSCADPDLAVTRFVLERLTVEQMAFLRFYGHTLAEQPVAEYPHGIEFNVAADDGVWDDDLDDWIIPASRHWFASGHLRFGPCGTASFVKLNPLGLLLRDCLMAGADCAVPHYVPASRIETEGHDRATGHGAEHESPASKRDAQDIAQ